MRSDADLYGDPVELDDPALRERLTDLVGDSYRLYARVLHAVDVFDRRHLSQADGFRNTKTWLIGALGMASVTAHRLVKTARLLRDLPKLAAAVDTGQVSPEHMQQVVSLADQVDVSRLVEVDDALAEAAQVLDVTRFSLVCQRVVAHLNPDGADPGGDFDKRGLTLSPSGRMTLLRGQLDPEGAAALTTALDALMKPPGEGDTRTAAQRRADALVELARLHLAAGDLPTVGGQRPQVGVLAFPQALSPRALAKLAQMQQDSFAAQRLRHFAAMAEQGLPVPDPEELFGRTSEAMNDNLDQPEADQPEADQPEAEEPDGEQLESYSSGASPGTEAGSDADSGSGSVSGGARDGDGTAVEAGAQAPPAESEHGGQPRRDTTHSDSGGDGTTDSDGTGGGDGTVDQGPGGDGPEPLRPGWLGPDPAQAAQLAAAADAVRQPVWSRSGWADPPWLNWVGPIPNEVAQRLACDADIFRIIMDPDTGMPLDVGRAYRLVPYWIRKALYARDRGCRWRGCNAPAEWTDAHHLDEFAADNGETKVERCLLLCRYHHGLVHEGGWSIDLDPHTGEVIILRPGGLPYHLPRGPTSPSWNGPASHTR